MLMDAESEQVESYRADIERLKKRCAILIDLLYKMEAKANRHEDLIAELAEALAEANPSNRLLLRAKRALEVTDG